MYHDPDSIMTLLFVPLEGLRRRAHEEQASVEEQAAIRALREEVFYDEIQSDFDDSERIEYLKRITMVKEPTQSPHARACPRPLHSERKARDAARRGHERRERGSRPTRARP